MVVLLLRAGVSISMSTPIPGDRSFHLIDAVADRIEFSLLQNECGLRF
jgi:hypothetical protein